MKVLLGVFLRYLSYIHEFCYWEMHSRCMLGSILCWSWCFHLYIHRIYIPTYIQIYHTHILSHIRTSTWASEDHSFPPQRMWLPFSRNFWHWVSNLAFWVFTLPRSIEGQAKPVTLSAWLSQGCILFRPDLSINFLEFPNCWAILPSLCQENNENLVSFYWKLVEPSWSAFLLKAVDPHSVLEIMCCQKMLPLGSTMDFMKGDWCSCCSDSCTWYFKAALAGRNSSFPLLMPCHFSSASNARNPSGCCF